MVAGPGIEPGTQGFSVSGYIGIRQGAIVSELAKKSQTGTRLPLSGVEFSQPRPGHHRSHLEWQRTFHSHPFQIPQRLPRKLDQAAETIWDGINMANIFFVCQLKLYFSG